MQRPLLILAPVLLAASLLSMSGLAQDPTHPHAKAEDVDSIESIVAALYDAVSGPAGERDWKRLESLFAEEVGRYTPIAPGGSYAESWTPRDYEARVSGFYLENAAYTRELARRVERFGPLAQVWSTYAIGASPEAEPLQRGINSIQLFFDGERWFILSVSFYGESEDEPIPAEYLK